MIISSMSIFKPKAKQICKATFPPFKQHFSKCPNQRKILSPILAHRMLSSLSNELILYLLHYQTPCISRQKQAVGREERERKHKNNRNDQIKSRWPCVTPYNNLDLMKYLPCYLYILCQLVPDVTLDQVAW